MQLKRLLSISLLTMLVYYGNAQEYVLDSAYYDVGVNMTEDFESVRRNFYRSYDEDNRPLIIETQRNDGNSVWENWRRRDYTYSAEGELTQMRVSVWRPNTEAWSAFEERLFTYDEMGNILTKQVRVALQAGGELLNTRRWEHTYDEQDFQTEVLLQRWDDGAWANDSRQEWNYNANGLPTQQRRQIWTGTAWQDIRRRMWDYSSGIVSMVTEQVFDQDE